MSCTGWYPGHMAGTEKRIKEQLPLMDLVLEVADARIPLTGRNPELGNMLQDKPLLLVLNKRDLAGQEESLSWLQYYQQRMPTVLLNALSGEGLPALRSQLKKEARALREREQARGRQERPLRLMVVGLPNVGKSRIINLLAKKRRVKVGKKPGLTRGEQWIKLEEGLHLLDTPGLLSPLTEGEEAIFFLSLTGTLPASRIDLLELACKLLSLLSRKKPEVLKEAYKLEPENTEAWELLHQLCRNRGFLLSGGRMDLERGALALLRAFQSGSLGPLTLETPPEEVDESATPPF